MEKGDIVEIEYTGRLESGEVFDLTDEGLAKKEKIYNPKARYGPIPVIVGGGIVVPGLDEALLQMKVGEERKVEIEPEKAFGARDAKMVKVVPTAVFRKERVDPFPGMVVNFSGATGRVQSVSSGRVMVDFNNPLAGRKLLYDVKIVKKIDGAAEKTDAILRFFDMKADVSVEGNVVSIKGVVRQELKKTIVELITTYVKMEKVNFIESYEAQSAGVKESVSSNIG